MLTSYVLRLLPSELAHGRLVGEIEAVATGQQRAIRGADELLNFCAANCPVVEDEPVTPRPVRGS